MKSLIFLTIFLLNLLNANNDLIDIYRTQGIKALETKIDTILTEKSYWDQYLQNIDVSNGYYESIQYILKCSKELNQIEIYQYNNKKNNLIYKSDIITGKHDGQKNIEGDLKTPIGVYTLRKKLTKLDPFYGPLALVTTYPNNFDKSYGKTGSGIWIHGFPKSKKRKPYTKGCIALKNKNLLQLDQCIDFKKSILIIEDKPGDTTVSKNDISIILSQIFLWKEAWKSNNLEKYLSFYSDEFKKSNQSNLQDFIAYKTRIFAKNEQKEIQFSKINITPYPNYLGKTMFKINLFEQYHTKWYQFIGYKDIYIELINDKIKILNEG